MSNGMIAMKLQKGWGQGWQIDFKNSNLIVWSLLLWQSVTVTARNEYKTINRYDRHNISFLWNSRYYCRNFVQPILIHFTNDGLYHNDRMTIPHKILHYH